MSSLLSFIKTNTNFGSGTTVTGVDPTTSGISVRTDADTTRTFTETILKDVVQEIFSSGGTPAALFVGPALKQTVSSFPGIAQQRYQAGNKPTTIISAADAYLSDFGLIQVVPNRFMRSRDALVLDPEFASLAYLRPFVTNELARTGDAEKTQIIAELTLQVSNEAAHGGAFDLHSA